MQDYLYLINPDIIVFVIHPSKGVKISSVTLLVPL